MAIDFVIPWVDGNDREWQEQKRMFLGDDSDEAIDVSKNRYRDWDNLHYWFRGVELFAPWVRKIHFVTWGHTPEWLKTEHPKLNIVKHEDFIPSEYLPTFSSHPIELNLHRIPDLSENFVYFNDDTFITRKVYEHDFFINDLPCDIAGLNALSPIELFSYIVFNNVYVINKHFDKKRVIYNNIRKWFSFRYGRSMLKTFLLLPWSRFTGFVDLHLPIAYKKETFEEVWRVERNRLDDTCRNRFRSKNDLSGWLFRYWRIAKGEFVPMNPNIGKSFAINDDNNDSLFKAVLGQRYKLICANDSLRDEGNFESIRDELNRSFQAIFPRKSSFER
jgi:hypothetical protein